MQAKAKPRIIPMEYNLKSILSINLAKLINKSKIVLNFSEKIKKVAKNWLNLQKLVKNVKKCNFSLNLQELRKFQ